MAYKSDPKRVQPPSRPTGASVPKPNLQTHHGDISDNVRHLRVNHPVYGDMAGHGDWRHPAQQNALPKRKGPNYETVVEYCKPPEGAAELVPGLKLGKGMRNPFDANTGKSGDVE